jgi:type VI secretion system secreted protein Hcp
MAADFYLKITGIDGESTDSAHKGEIEVLSFSSGVTMPISPNSTAGSKTRERANLSDLTITKVVDSASPALFKAVCAGTHLTEAILSVNRADGNGNKVEYLKYTLNDVVLSNYQAAGADGNGMPIENVSINFNKFKIEYKPTDPAKGSAMGAKMAGWDVMLNKPM